MSTGFVAREGRQPRSQGLSGGGKMKDPGNEVRRRSVISLFKEKFTSSSNFNLGDDMRLLFIFRRDFYFN